MSNSTNVKSKRKAHNALNTEKFIAKATAKHGDRYDYSKSVYTASTDKLIIICKTHGEFTQNPANHLTGNGCPYCAGKIQTTERTIKKLIDARGDRYDYSKVVYTKSNKKVKIICRIHGEFEQNIWQHIQGANCQTCSIIWNTERQKHNFDDLVKEFNITHDFAYDYSKSIYVNIDEPIEIICKKHGSFRQAPYHHRKIGAGCPICTKATPYSRTRYISACKRHGGESSLYIVKMFREDEVFYKVGITVKTIKSRFGKNPYNIETVKFIKNDSAFIYDLEKQIHRLLADYHYKPLHSFGGCHLECFSEIPKSIIDLIDRIEKSKQLQLLA